MIEKLLFLMFTFASFLLYYFWKSGYFLSRVKILLFFSFIGSLFSYFILYDFFININDSIFLILEKLFFFILLSMSSIFLIISITIPSDNPILKKTKTKESRKKLNRKKDQLNEKNSNILIERHNEILELGNHILSKDRQLNFNREGSNIQKDLQGFLDHLFKEQLK